MNNISAVLRRIKSIWNRRIRRPLVSVVVPIYNGEKTIKRCLNSIMNQTQKRLIIICVNDGLTDKTAQILEDYQLKDRRIRVINQENGGRSAARNAGLSAVKTKYVMFCDDDDEYEPDMCESMLNVIEDSQADIAACGIKVTYKTHSEMRESDDEYYRLKYEGKKDIDDEVIIQTDVSVCNKIFRVNIIKNYDIQFPDGLDNEDFYFYNAYMSAAKTIYFLNKKLYNYIRHSDSIMSDNFEKKKFSVDHLVVAEKLFDFYRKSDFLKNHKDLFWRQWIASFWFSYEHSDKKYYSWIKEEAGRFLENYYEKYKPSNKELQNWKDDVVKTLSDK